MWVTIGWKRSCSICFRKILLYQSLIRCSSLCCLNVSTPYFCSVWTAIDVRSTHSTFSLFGLIKWFEIDIALQQLLRLISCSIEIRRSEVDINITIYIADQYVWLSAIRVLWLVWRLCPLKFIGVVVLAQIEVEFACLEINNFFSLSLAALEVGSVDINRLNCKAAVIHSRVACCWHTSFSFSEVLFGQNNLIVVVWRQELNRVVASIAAPVLIDILDVLVVAGLWSWLPFVNQLLGNCVRSWLRTLLVGNERLRSDILSNLCLSQSLCAVLQHVGI